MTQCNQSRLQWPYEKFMLGANWKKDPSKIVDEKFAWWPIRTTSKKRVWLKKYVEVNVYIDNEMAHPIRSNTWTYRYTKNEYLPF